MGDQQRASTLTTLSFGLVKAPIALYKTSGEIEDVTWDQAGPHGGVLVTETVIAGTQEIYDPLEEQLVASLAQAEPADDLAVIDLEAAVQVHQENVVASAAVVTERAIFELVEKDGETVKQFVPPDAIRRGRRLPDGRFLDLTEAVEQIDEQTSLDEMEVVAFIRREKVPRDRIVGSYYVGARGATRPLRLLADRMRKKERVAVVKWGKRKNQATGVLLADGRGLKVLQVVFAADVRPRPEDAILPLVSVTDREAEFADQLIDAMSDSADVFDDLIDDRRRLFAELEEKVRNGEVFELVPKPEPVEGSSLDEQLQASAEMLRRRMEFESAASRG